MALFEGMTPETTESLGGSWCGDLLQIVDELPQNFNLINCCFINLARRGWYIYDKYGTDDQNYLVKDKNNNRLVGHEINIIGKRAELVHLKVEKNKDRFCLDPVPV